MAYSNIKDPSAHFQAETYTGAGANTAVTFSGNSNLQPDFLWIKNRGAGYGHFVVDSNRNISYAQNSSNAPYLETNSAVVENNNQNWMQSVNTDGFTTGISEHINNNSGSTFVAWAWKANGGTTASNTDGNITSTVQANTDAGFSIVTYTGTGSGTSNPSVGHGLGVTPQVVLVKGRSQANGWVMYHYGIDGANSRNKYLQLNEALPAGTLANYWGTTASGGVTSSTFGVYADNQSGNNYLNATHVAYCFAEKQGYSKFGKYYGNGSEDGTFVYTGFKPAMIIAHRSSNNNKQWLIKDNARNPFNEVDFNLYPNSDSAETNTSIRHEVDFLSNGFKIRDQYDLNQASGTFIYMAFAETPFVAGGVPTTAR